MNKNNYLQLCYEDGFVPGPNESFEAFETRVEKAKKLLANPEEFLQKLKIPYETIHPITPYFLAITTKKGLPPWYGAMTLIYDDIAILELPKRKWKFLKQEEIIAHEKVHFFRSQFFEPRFEEIIAYRTSSSSWRRYLSPIFQYPWESTICIILFFALAISPIFPHPEIVFFLNGGFLSFLLIRLIRNQWIFRKALKNLKNKTIIRLLTDKEIIATSKGHLVPDSSSRWALIKLLEI